MTTATKYWINSLSNEYVEGDQPSSLHIEVPQRPDYTHDWDGTKWVQNPDKVSISAPSVEEQLAAIRKAIVKNDKTDIIAIDAQIPTKVVKG